MIRLTITIINIGIMPRINWRIAKPIQSRCRMSIVCRSFSLIRGIRPSSAVTYVSFFFEINSNRVIF